MKEFTITVNGKSYEVTVEEKKAGAAPAPAVKAAPAPAPAPVAPVVPKASADTQEKIPGTITAPMPGKLLSIAVQAGQHVNKGDFVCVIEAMKMENEIPSPFSGTVKEIFAVPGNPLAVGEAILRIE